MPTFYQKEMNEIEKRSFILYLFLIYLVNFQLLLKCKILSIWGLDDMKP